LFIYFFSDFEETLDRVERVVDSECGMIESQCICGMGFEFESEAEVDVEKTKQW
jgi:hypothetical protein